MARILGEGGDGFVVEASSSLVVKVTNNRDRLEAERRAYAALGSEACVAGFFGALPELNGFLLLERLDCDLHNSCDYDVTLRCRPEMLKHVVVQLINAVVRIHSCGIVHRDLKPSNIMLAENQMLKVIDFGLACRIDEAPTEALAGTWPYMTLERLRGVEDGISGDFFALGMIVFQMVYGMQYWAYSQAPIFNGHSMPYDTLLGLVVKTLERDRLHIPNKNIPVDADLMDLMVGLLRLDARQRYGLAEVLSSRFLKKADFEGVARAHPALADDMRTLLELRAVFHKARPFNAMFLLPEESVRHAVLAARPLALARGLLTQDGRLPPRGPPQPRVDRTAEVDAAALSWLLYGQPLATAPEAVPGAAMCSGGGGLQDRASAAAEHRVQLDEDWHAEEQWAEDGGARTSNAHAFDWSPPRPQPHCPYWQQGGDNGRRAGGRSVAAAAAAQGGGWPLAGAVMFDGAAVDVEVGFQYAAPKLDACHGEAFSFSQSLDCIALDSPPATTAADVLLRGTPTSFGGGGGEQQAEAEEAPEVAAAAAGRADVVRSQAAARPEDECAQAQACHGEQQGAPLDEAQASPTCGRRPFNHWDSANSANRDDRPAGCKAAEVGEDEPAQGGCKAAEVSEDEPAQGGCEEGSGPRRRGRLGPVRSRLAALFGACFRPAAAL